MDSARYGTGPLARLASVQDGDPITVTGAGGYEDNIVVIAKPVN